ncbi:MAG: DUF3990 domain-containing protein [Kiritimatiellae bacterium]|nr:DUF3990 domain-containing protein [Kiritimatiellia bacterium]
MKVYHTSTKAVPKPDTRHSRSHLDFGKGFYLTPIEQQARDYGRRFLLRGKPAAMNVYRLDDDIPDAICKVFDAYDGEWLDFIAACRKGRPHRAYDVITGGIADDQVFNTVDLYLQGLITRRQALNRLRWKKPNLQICITSQAVLDRHLRFVKSIELKP